VSVLETGSAGAAVVAADLRVLRSSSPPAPILATSRSTSATRASASRWTSTGISTRTPRTKTPGVWRLIGTGESPA